MKNKQCLVIDNGNFVFIAERLAKDFDKVFYYCPNTSALPKIHKSIIGLGLGVYPIRQMFYKEKVFYIKEDIIYDFENIDLFVFCDVGCGDIQEHIINYINLQKEKDPKIDKRVFGCRLAEDLELYRYETKELMKEIGLPVNKCVSIVGITKLREYLEKNDDKYIKLSYWRGQGESWHHTDIKTSERRLLRMEYDLGDAKDIIEFVVEDPIVADVETGWDTFVSNGVYPNNIGIGIEIKDQSYLATYKEYNKLAPQIKESLDKMLPVFKEYGVNGAISTEIRVGGDGKNYVCDFSCRFGSPPSELQTLWIENFSELIWEVSGGKMIEPKYKSKYAMQVAIISGWAKDNWMTITLDEKYRDNFKLKYHCKINDMDLIEPFEDIGYIVVCDDTIDGCIKQLEYLSDKIDGEGIDIQLESLEDIKDVIIKARKKKMVF